MNYISVGLNEIKQTKKNSRIIYTVDLCTCIACVIHKKDKTYLMHIEAYEEGNINLKRLISLLDSEKDINVVDLFKGPYTNNENLDLVTRLLDKHNIHYGIYDGIITRSNLCGIAYNEEDDNYYSVIMENGKAYLKKQEVIK